MQSCSLEMQIVNSNDDDTDATTLLNQGRFEQLGPGASDGHFEWV